MRTPRVDSYMRGSCAWRIMVGFRASPDQKADIDLAYDRRRQMSPSRYQPHWPLSTETDGDRAPDPLPTRLTGEARVRELEWSFELFLRSLRKRKEERLDRFRARGGLTSCADCVRRRYSPCHRHAPGVRLGRLDADPARNRHDADAYLKAGVAQTITRALRKEGLGSCASSVIEFRPEMAIVHVRHWRYLRGEGFGWSRRLEFFVEVLVNRRTPLDGPAREKLGRDMHRAVEGVMTTANDRSLGGERRSRELALALAAACRIRVGFEESGA